MTPVDDARTEVERHLLGDVVVGVEVGGGTARRRERGHAWRAMGPARAAWLSRASSPRSASNLASHRAEGEVRVPPEASGAY